MERERERERERETDVGRAPAKVATVGAEGVMTGKGAPGGRDIHMHLL